MTALLLPSRRLVLRLQLLLPLLATALLGLGLLACANGEIRLGDPFDRAQTLEAAQHRYTVLVRWAEFQKAKAFVAEEERPAFILRMKELEEARFTDYESESVEISDDHQKATVRVTYTLYLPHSPYEMEMVETQEWARNGVGNHWRVRSVFDGLPAVAAR